MPQFAHHHALRKGRHSCPGQIYLLTAVTMHRNPIFADFEIARVAASCHHDQRLLSDTRMLAWVLMPDHAHWLLQLGEEHTLSGWVARFKATIARRVNSIRGQQTTLWQSAFHDHAIRKQEDLPTLARYIVANPIRAGLVRRVGDYPFWNAVWL